jgi:hypothetical protein
MAAMITLAEPSIAWATGLDGLLSWLAIWAWDCRVFDTPAPFHDSVLEPAPCNSLLLSRIGIANCSITRSMAARNPLARQRRRRAGLGQVMAEPSTDAAQPQKPPVSPARQKRADGPRTSRAASPSGGRAASQQRCSRRPVTASPANGGTPGRGLLASQHSCSW